MDNLTTPEKIRLISKRLGKSMGDLAEATGQTRQNLSNKMGRNNLSEKEIVALAEAMDCTVEVRFKLPDGTEI